ncbi:AB hydrolase-1 domain-containing protein [Fusarium falciforme]|uniref:AB hydrolase-1 domain-containing protein n=1 Tax=Fusarium falciforme TaxID=195108 RepID=UPI0022FFC820|nr:AB hydrolase-1 domain-containing protein [Fusarium falciforme]WAO92626.1 AB hydrolase-1 domain-containing protein [Fusarium falciforme]
MLFKQLVAFAAVANGLAIRQDTPIWQTLPPTPDLPSPINTKTTLINGVQLWMQKYNEHVGGIPIVMDHGGLGYSAYFGSVISRLVAKGHYVIAVDRRGHGRSTFNTNDVFTYDQMADDIHDQLAAAGVSKYNVVGWSDGAITTLAALINPTLAVPIHKAFIFGGSANPEQTNATFSDTAIFSEFVSRCRVEYAELQPNANFSVFANKVGTMEATLPQMTDEQFGTIDGSRVIIVGAEHEEAVNRDVPEKLHKAIKGSKLEILPGVSHFAPLQDPDQFTKAVEKFFA